MASELPSVPLAEVEVLVSEYDPHPPPTRGRTKECVDIAYQGFIEQARALKMAVLSSTESDVLACQYEKRRR